MLFFHETFNKARCKPDVSSHLAESKTNTFSITTALGDGNLRETYISEKAVYSDYKDKCNLQRFRVGRFSL